MCEDLGTADEELKPAFEIEATLLATINLADFQNAVPVLRALAIVNNTKEALREVVLRLTSDPPIFGEKSWQIEQVPSEDRRNLPNLDLTIESGMLTRLTESEPAQVRFSLHPRESPSEELASSTRLVEILPRNQWAGINHIPEMVAAFVQPNDPGVERLIKQAAEILRSHGKDPALNGYKGGAKRAWELASALWSAVVNLQLDYALPPASFEYSGQKVRAPGQILDSRLGTCLDLALLFAASLEQMGLNPILVFTKGHAFCGVWLKEEEFSTVVVDDVTALRKRTRLNELLLFETTLVTNQPRGTFSSAIQVANRKVSEGEQEDFELAVDIRRARLQRIKPLASAEGQPVAAGLETEPAVEAPVFEEAPDLPADVTEPEIVDPASLTPAGRLARWQRKLLDLSLRNNLLNFRGGKKALRLEAPDPGALEDLLADGRELKILPAPDLMDGTDPRSQAIHESRAMEDLRKAHATEALQRLDLFVKLPQDELDGRMTELFRGARTALQEGGANTLFVALGFLTWTRDDKAGRRFKAPLILIPVELNRNSIRSGFRLKIHEDEPRFNPTLIEMLRQDFRLNLREFEGELPKDEHGLDVHEIWAKVSRAVKDIKGWEVTDEVYLSTFSFAKYLMWKDLTDRSEQLRANDVVRHLIDDPRSAYTSDVSFPDAKHLDRDLLPETSFAPLPADSSQLRAIVAGSKGKDFVLIGPPGTGKSQTISNLIAQCLAEGKRVLFVSEKIVALDVVYRRLRDVGLGEFCLELHSNKAKKADVLLQLQRSWEASGDLDPSVWKARADKLYQLRAKLNEYVANLHVRRSNGMTLFDAIGLVASGEDVPVIKFNWPVGEHQSLQELEQLKDLVDRLEANGSAAGIFHEQSQPLRFLGNGEWSPTWQRKLLDSAEQCEEIARALTDAYTAFCEQASIPKLPITLANRNAIRQIMQSLRKVEGRDFSFAMRGDAAAHLSDLRSGLHLLNSHHALTESLSSDWPDPIRLDCRKGLALIEARRSAYSSLPAAWPPDTLNEAIKGLRLLQRAQKARASLSVEYSNHLEALNVHQLHRDWQEAEASVWGLSWFRKRKVRNALTAACMGPELPDVGADLLLLVDLRTVRMKIAEHRIGPELADVWKGESTGINSLAPVISLQEAVEAVHGGTIWTDSGFEAISRGACGPSAQQTLSTLRQIRDLDSQVEALGYLGDATDGLWSGLGTDIELLNEALAFREEVSGIRPSGSLAHPYDRIVSGECGPTAARDWETLAQRAPVERKIAALAPLGLPTSGLWNGLATSSTDAQAVIDIAEGLESAISGPAADHEIKTALRHGLRNCLEVLKGVSYDRSTLGAAGSRFSDLEGGLDPAVDALVALARVPSGDQIRFKEGDLAEAIHFCHSLLSDQPRIRAWCGWRKVCIEANRESLEPLIHAMESGAVSEGSVRRVFEVNHARWWVNVVVDSDQVIREFVSTEHEKRIRDFRELDDEVTRLTKLHIRAKLCAEHPGQEVPKNSEWGVLRHEMNKKKRHMPLRELISEIPTALTKLTPCLLMSPLSIAQYLPANSSVFDLVIFDEASQIPVWDAVGAIARAKRAVIVGDPKQLPPTNFFDRAESEEDDEDVEGDLESILDECRGSNLPEMSLNWHYRSKHESLIAFSNHRYYGGSLVTFPSPVTQDRAVSFHPVAGTYEKGGARTNQAEAKALVADIIALLNGPGFRQSGLTVGVVTFNTEQKSLIEDLLEEERRKDPEIESHFSDDALEPLEVKNLESVQGDERDIMYFSITYGPSPSGAVSMNFGPMNRTGGERRLNVAITRARQELRVFSSLKADQIDLSRTQAQGVADLKQFLDFADRGPRALLEAHTASLGGYESPFEKAVAEALGSLGWVTHPQIGASQFRIDLAIVHPDAPGRYLAGVECDGATYHRSATARDRDKLREHVLRGLGWKIVRIWSTDWWADRSGTLKRVDEQLKAILEASRTSAQHAEPPVQPVREATIETAAVASIDQVDGFESPHGSSPNEESSKPQAGEPRYSSLVAAKPSAQFNPFTESDPTSAVPGVNPDAFFYPSYDTRLAEMIAHVIEVEGPVLDAVLAKRISRAHGWQRTGGKIWNRVIAQASRRHKISKESIGTFYWPDQIDPDQLFPFRSWDSEMDRSVDEVSIRELGWLARDIRRFFVDDESAASQMARVLGLQRLRQSTRDRLLEAVHFSKSFNL